MCETRPILAIFSRKERYVDAALHHYHYHYYHYHYYHHYHYRTANPFLLAPLVSFCHIIPSLSFSRPLLRVAARLHHQGNVAAASRARALTHAHKRAAAHGRTRAGGYAMLMSKNDAVCVADASAVFRDNGLPSQLGRRERGEEGRGRGGEGGGACIIQRRKYNGEPPFFFFYSFFFFRLLFACFLPHRSPRPLAPGELRAECIRGGREEGRKFRSRTNEITLYFRDTYTFF